MLTISNRRGRILSVSKRQQTVTEAVRRAVEKSGALQIQICEATGIDKAALSRFMAGRTSLTLTSVDRLAEVLGLVMIARGPVKVAPPRKRGRKPKRKG